MKLPNSVVDIIFEDHFVDLINQTTIAKTYNMPRITVQRLLYPEQAKRWETNAKIRKLAKDGLTPYQITKQLGVTASNVRRVLELPTTRKPKSDEQRTKALTNYRRRMADPDYRAMRYTSNRMSAARRHFIALGYTPEQAEYTISRKPS